MLRLDWFTPAVEHTATCPRFHVQAILSNGPHEPYAALVVEWDPGQFTAIVTGADIGWQESVHRNLKAAANTAQMVIERALKVRPPHQI